MAYKFEDSHCELVCFDGLFKLGNFDFVVEGFFVRSNELPTVEEFRDGSRTLLQDSVGGGDFDGEFSCSVKHV